MNDSENSNQDLPKQIDILKKRADMLGIAYSPNIGVATLNARIKAKMGETDPDTVKVADTELSEDSKAAATGRTTSGKVIPPKPVLLTRRQKNARIKEDALRLVRVNVTCMDKNKSEWEGETFTMSNSIIGTVTKYVPYNTTDGWNVPHIIYQHMLEKKCQVFHTIKDARGTRSRQSKLVNALSVQLLPPLDAAELRALANRQAMANNQQ